MEIIEVVELALIICKKNLKYNKGYIFSSSVERDLVGGFQTNCQNMLRRKKVVGLLMSAINDSGIYR